jgi:hypothetical protein
VITVWLYRHTEPGLWTVGFYDPHGVWHPVSDHGDSEEAAERCHWLNGGNARSIAVPGTPPADADAAGGTV